MTARTEPGGERVTLVCVACAAIVTASVTILVFANLSLAAVAAMYGGLLTIVAVVFLGFFLLSLVLTGLVLWLRVPAYVPIVVLSTVVALYQSSFYLAHGTWETGETCGQAGGLEIDCAYDHGGITLAILTAILCIPVAVLFLRTSRRSALRKAGS